MTTPTYGQVLGAHDVEIPAHLAAQAEVPVLSGPQRQGDLLVIPTRIAADLGQPIPTAGIAVVRGEAGGNTHLLVAEGPVTWRPTNDSTGLELGTVTVADDATAYLLHPEHGAQGIAPGAYRIRRQREQADEIRTVAD